MDSVRDQVRAYIVDSFLMRKRADGLRDDTSFLAQGILDSTGVVELVAFLEERFGIRVLDEEIIPENLDSLQALERFVQRKRAPAANPAGSP
jgi:acyl carrier protein